MPYPQIVEYNDAIQHPQSAFSDPELQRGLVEQTPLGLPLALSGGFALTYKIQSGAKRFAVRCFHREVPEAQAKYAAISAKLKSLSSSYFVNFAFDPRGIRVGQTPVPIVKMDWVEGDTLGVYLEKISTNRQALETLRRQFRELALFLEVNGIAHGDIQNDNVIVDRSGLRLIDYDGMYVPGMTLGSGTEVGQKHFQHPGRTTRDFGPAMDRFSFIALDVSLEAIAADPSLHKRFYEGGLTVIFKANDFHDPSASEVFRLLQANPSLRDSAKKMEAVATASIGNVPTLSDFLAGRNIPAPVQRPASLGPKSVSEPTYLGAFDVVDGRNFAATMRRVGDKVELIGKIVSVKSGVGKRGRGKGRPYVFINFGPWNRESVKITIWSEGLGAISNPPTEAWVNRWISVTGLIEPPYQGQHYGKPYTNVGITVVSNNQIIQLSEKDAKFRLNGGVSSSSSSARKTNEDILQGLSGTPDFTQTTSRPRSGLRSGSRTSSTTSGSRNEQILAGLKSPAASSSSSSPAQKSSSSPEPSFFSKIPWWVWPIALYFVIALFSQ
ncbi:MAG: hypothetical protein AB7I36_17905 [Rhodospirillaceae bacterium]